LFVKELATLIAVFFHQSPADIANASTACNLTLERFHS
jgi:hypothetical protein